MAKKRKSFLSSLLITGVVISLTLGGLLYYLKSAKSAEVLSPDEVNERLATISDPRKREIARITIAARSFEAQHQRLPESLSELVPVYLSTIPIDPKTNQPFEYKVSGTQMSIGANVKEDATIPAHLEAVRTTSSPQTSSLTTVDALIAEFDNREIETVFVYDATGKRDPFMPFDFSPRVDPDDPNRTPLERFGIGQLKLVAVLGGQLGEPTAIVETANGKGYTVRKGTKIGQDNGVVVEILPDRLLILESTIDFTGEKKTRTVELKLRVPGQETDESGYSAGKRKSAPYGQGGRR